MAFDLTKLFNQFAGKEVPVKEQCIRTKTGGYTQVELADQNDPTIQAMEKLAKTNGFQLRVWLPGTMGTMDMRGDRINAYIEKGADSKWRVSSNFKIG